MTDRPDSRPVPDPTILTTEASIRLEATLREVINKEVAHLDALFIERHAHIDTQFRLLDVRTAEQKKDTKDALDAALAAQKEAVTKSETATIERIRSVETLLATSTQALSDKISDLKDRVIAIESIKLGAVETITNAQSSNADFRGSLSSVISIILAIITIGSVMIAVLKP